MHSQSKVYADESGSKKVDVIIWDALIPITEIKKCDGVQVIFKAGVRDGVRYVNITEAKVTKDGKYSYKRGGGISIPIYMPVNKGTEIIKPFLDFVKAFQQTVEAHTNVPLEDPETQVIVTRDVKSRKENIECNESETLEMAQE